MRYLFIISIVLSVHYLNAQSSTLSYSWGLKVYDHSSGEPMIGVNVFDSQNEIGSSTDRNGKCTIQIKKWPVTFKVSYLGYISRTVTAENSSQLPQKIILSQDKNRLSEVVVSDKVIPKKVSGKWRSVTDFILVDDKMLYIENGGNLGSSKLVLSTLDGEVLDEANVSDYKLFENLYLSCQETPYLVCEYDAIQLDLENNKIVSQFTSRRQDFESLVRPCKASNDLFLYHGTLAVNQELAKITQINRETYAKSPLTQVYDTEQVKQTSKSIELIKLYSRLAKHSAFYAGLVAKEKADLIYYRNPVNYDVFTVKDKTLVMDHENSKIAFFDQSNKHIKDVSIFYNQQKNWSGIVRQDPITEKIYIVVYDKNSLILHELNIDNGVLVFIAFMDVDMIDKLDVHDGTLWYTSSTLSGPGIGKRLHKLDM